MCECMYVSESVRVSYLRALAQERMEGTVRNWRHSSRQTTSCDRGLGGPGEEEAWVEIGKGSSVLSIHACTYVLCVYLPRQFARTKSKSDVVVKTSKEV